MNPITELIAASPEAFLCLLLVIVIVSSLSHASAYCGGRFHQAVKDRRRRKIIAVRVDERGQRDSQEPIRAARAERRARAECVRTHHRERLGDAVQRANLGASTEHAARAAVRVRAYGLVVDHEKHVTGNRRRTRVGKAVNAVVDLDIEAARQAAKRKDSSSAIRLNAIRTIIEKALS